MKRYDEWIDEWNDLHQECGKIARERKLSPVDHAVFRNNRMADYCEEKILEAKEIYYGSGDIIMDDRTYDRFEDILRQLRPTSKILNKVGY